MYHVLETALWNNYADLEVNFNGTVFKPKKLGKP